MFTPAMNISPLYKHVILFISMLESLQHAFLWENINERYLEILLGEMLQWYFHALVDLNL
jgi:hypothetical protein